MARGRQASKALTQRTQQALGARIARDGVTPLEVIVEAMRHHHGLWERAADPKELAMAVEYAKQAAPYVHPKVQPVAPDHSSLLRGGDGQSGIVQIEFVESKNAPSVYVDRSAVESKK